MSDCATIHKDKVGVVAVIPYTMPTDRMKQFLYIFKDIKSPEYTISREENVKMIKNTRMYGVPLEKLHIPLTFKDLSSYSDKFLLGTFPSSTVFLYHLTRTPKKVFAQYAHCPFTAKIILSHYKDLLKEPTAKGKLRHYEVYKNHLDVYITPNQREMFYMVTRQYMEQTSGLDYIFRG